MRLPPATLPVILVAGGRRHAQALIAQTEQVLAPLGLTLSREKTSIAHIDEGIEFLGWKIQRQPGHEPPAGLYLPVQTVASGRQRKGQTDLPDRLQPDARPAAAPAQPGAARLVRLLPPRCRSRTFGYLRAYVWRRVIILAATQAPRTELALAPTPLPARLVADRRNGRPLQPRRGEDHPLPLPRKQDPHPVAAAGLHRLSFDLEPLEP